MFEVHTCTCQWDFSVLCLFVWMQWFEIWVLEVLFCCVLCLTGRCHMNLISVKFSCGFPTFENCIGAHELSYTRWQGFVSRACLSTYRSVNIIWDNYICTRIMSVCLSNSLRHMFNGPTKIPFLCIIIYALFLC